MTADQLKAIEDGIQAGMTCEESLAFHKAGELFNDIQALSVLHNADMGDVEWAIHAIQNIIMSRVFYRKYKAQ